MDFSQERIDSRMTRIVTNFNKFRQALKQTDFQKYVTILDGFFKGTLTVKDFLLMCEELVPKELNSEHDEIRNLLCELGETKVSAKIVAKRRAPPNDQEHHYEFSDLGDVRARSAIALASRGLLMEHGFAEFVHEAIQRYIFDILLYATQTEIELDGFVVTEPKNPFTMQDLKDALERRANDESLTEGERFFISKELVKLNKIS